MATAALALSAGMVALPASGHAQHAHTHGQLRLDVAVDARSLTLSIESPLDGFLGFERAPRTDAEREQVTTLLERLRAADQLFQPDPAARCRLSAVKLSSAVLGLGDSPASSTQNPSSPAVAGEAQGHADIVMDVAFHCEGGVPAKFIDVKLFEAYKRLRHIQAQVASPQGQFKRSLRPGAPRLSLGR